MKKELQDSILADIALYIQSVEERIRIAETEPLTEETVSKRHIRILNALCYASITQKTVVHADLVQIREIVALQSTKHYSLSDIRVFTFDLANRGYLNHVEHEEHGDLFAVIPESVELLESMESLLPKHFDQSTTPNFFFGIRH